MTLRIVDFSTHLSGPLASHLLAELGADVVKVENPRTGDGNRGLFPVVDDVGLLDLALNSGARSLAIDRRSPEWPELIAACARWADAVIVGARPADARRRGMDFATLQASNQKLIYCSISGFGDAGPWRDRTAHGQNVDMLAGLVPIDEDEIQPTTRRGWRSAGATLAGVFAALGIMAALHRRAEGADHGQYVSVSLWHAAMWWSWRDTTMLANADKPWVDYTDLGSRYGLYETADGRVLLLAPIEQKFWRAFCDLAGLPEETRERGDWTGSACYGEGPEFADERREIAARVKERTLDQWVALLESSDVPFAPLLTINEALTSEHAEANGVLRDVDVRGQALRIPASPIRFGQSDDRVDPPAAMPGPPTLGQHSAEIRRQLGLASDTGGATT